MLFPAALAKLDSEIVPVTTPVSSSAEYLKSLAISLFYKVCTYVGIDSSMCVCKRYGVPFVPRVQYYLAVIYDHVDPRVQSAAVPFQRPLSTGTQTYGTKPSEYPVTEPMTKLTALLQV